MPPGTALFPDAHHACRNIHIIMDSNHILRLQLVPAHQRPYALAAVIHIGLRLHQKHLFRANPGLCHQSLFMLPPVTGPQPFCQGIYQHPAYIVLRPGVFAAGIAQACNYLHIFCSL